MRIDPADLEPRDLYRLMISVVVPRPIAWVSTRSPDGVLNAAPFSYFQALSSAPPSLMISVGRKRDGSPKDTLANIEATREFVVNVVSEPSAGRMVHTSVAFDAGVSEFEQAGLQAVPSEKVAPPRIAESLASMECRLDRVLHIGKSGIVIGEIVMFHLADEVATPDRVADPFKLRPLGRLGGSLYAPLREVVEVATDERVTSVGGELLDAWRELRDRSIAMVRALQPDHLARVGRTFRHLAGCTTYLRLSLQGRADEDEMKDWDPSWTAERIATELEQDREAFIEAMRGFLPKESYKLRRMIRHEAWHQGQVAAALSDAFAESELWRL